MSIKIKQRDITDCGAACLASIAAHYKLIFRYRESAKWLEPIKKAPIFLD